VGQLLWLLTLLQLLLLPVLLLPCLLPPSPALPLLWLRGLVQHYEQQLLQVLLRLLLVGARGGGQAHGKLHPIALLDGLHTVSAQRSGCHASVGKHLLP
jgi:hypothetical protein